MPRTQGGSCGAICYGRLADHVDLVHPYRLVFERIGDVIQIARIVEILDFVKWTTIREASG